MRREEYYEYTGWCYCVDKPSYGSKRSRVLSMPGPGCGPRLVAFDPLHEHNKGYHLFVADPICAALGITSLESMGVAIVYANI